MKKGIAFLLTALSLFGAALPTAQAHAATDPSARIIFSSNRENPKGELYTAERDGSNVERLTFNSTVEAWAAASPDKKHIAYVSTIDEGDFSGTIELYDLATKQTKTIFDDDSIQPGSLAWSPDGTRLAFSSVSTESGYRSCISTLTLATRITEDILCGEVPLMKVDWSPGGNELLFTEYNRSTGGKLYKSAIQPGAEKKFITDGFSGVFSPAGDKIAFSRYDNQYIYQVFVANRDGSHSRQITHGESLSTVADWADDGYITYASVKLGTFTATTNSIISDGSGHIELPQRPTRATTYPW